MDFIKDNNPTIFSKLDELGITPDYVKSASAVSNDDLDKLHEVAFADQANREYPCHTKASCWKSAAYAAGNHVGDVDIRDGIDKMADVHGIKKEVDALFTIFGDIFEKSASELETPSVPEKKYALVLDFAGEDGRGVQGFYPITTPYETRKSASAVDSDYVAGKIPLSGFRKVASTIIEAANEFDISEDELPSSVVELGVVRVPNTQGGDDLVSARGKLGIDTAPYEKVASQVNEVLTGGSNVMSMISSIEKIASEVCSLDLDNDINYRNGNRNPYEILLNGPTVVELLKTAASTVEVYGVGVPVIDFINISDTTIDKLFSPEAANHIKSAKANVSGELTMAKTASADESIGKLGKETQRILLTTLADVRW